MLVLVGLINAKKGCPTRTKNLLNQPNTISAFSSLSDMMMPKDVLCVYFFYFLSPFLFPFGLCIFLSIICNAVCNLLAIKYIQVTYNRLSEIKYRMHYQLCCSKTLPFLLKKDNKFANNYVLMFRRACGHGDVGTGMVPTKFWQPP